VLSHRLRCSIAEKSSPAIAAAVCAQLENLQGLKDPADLNFQRKVHDGMLTPTPHKELFMETYLLKLNSVRHRLPITLKQAIKFLAVGVLNTAIDYVVLSALTLSIHELDAFQAVAKALSYSAGVLNSFYWNRRWTFRSNASWLVLAPFIVVSIIGVLINSAAYYIGLNWLMLSKNFAFLFATGISFFWNFVISKFVIFKK
jgi:putative flippase GtrA